uniref:Uncharacterized protein n=1 Tax=Arundo donax TaxID=35708 RepID=A0A0A9EYN5_ARUDO
MVIGHCVLYLQPLVTSPY